MSVHAPELLVEACDADHAIGMFGPFMLLNWRGAYTAKQADTCLRLHRRTTSLYPRGLAGIHVCEPESGLPSREAVSAASQTTRGLAPETLAIGITILGQGFMVSAMQSLTLNVFSIAAGVTMRTFRDVESNVAWIQPRVPGAPPIEAIEAAMAKLRATRP